MLHFYNTDICEMWLFVALKNNLLVDWSSLSKLFFNFQINVHLSSCFLSGYDYDSYQRDPYYASYYDAYRYAYSNYNYGFYDELYRNDPRFVHWCLLLFA